MFWLSPNIQTASARGGTEISIKGVFNSTWDLFKYVCIFTSENGEFSVASDGDLYDNFQLSCVVPEWNSASGNTTLSVVLILSATENFTVPPRGQRFFYFHEEWSGLSKLSPRLAPATGTTSITVLGFGFDVNYSLGYTCFFRLGELDFATAGTVLKFTSIVCPTPEIMWVPSISRETGQLPEEMLQPELGSELLVASLSLLRGGARVPYRNASAAAPSDCSRAPCEPVGIFPVLLGATLANGESELHADVTGGALIALTARGLTADGLHSCEFRDPATNATVVTSPPAPDGPVAPCPAPPWPLAGRASLRLLAARTGERPIPLHCAPPACALPFRVEFLPVWRAAAPTRSPARGGVPVLVSGAGFSPAVPLLCAFSRPAEAPPAGGGALALGPALVPAEVLDNETLRCSPPASAFAGAARGFARLAIVVAPAAGAAGAELAPRPARPDETPPHPGPAQTGLQP